MYTVCQWYYYQGVAIELCELWIIIVKTFWLFGLNKKILNQALDSF